MAEIKPTVLQKNKEILNILEVNVLCLQHQALFIDSTPLIRYSANIQIV